ncbi:hypothetical protein HID58_074545 [Brassica napus]|uniref:Replication protein A 70 kDa DNA-binding subunit B/D first OB fold domain-containing protein n=1 Tax=Brassica napus TaxID=3708 RepID=A0ABQ7YJT5_BRANA|nr:hypothetical protein HID58_074545 [Brassica napus]
MDNDIELLIPFDTKKSIRVKVLTNWNTVNGSLCNSPGFKIEASFENQIDPPNRVNLEVGAWFEIYNFKLIPASGLIRTTRSRYQIKLTPFSAISKIEPISESYFICLASFLKIKNGLSHTKFCVDLCGALVCVGEIEDIEDDEAGGAPIRQIQFSLINIGFTHLKCVAYGRLAEELNDFWSSTIANTVLCVLRLIEWGPSGFKFITNTEVSQILFDEDIPEIQEFKKRIPKSCF